MQNITVKTKEDFLRLDHLLQMAGIAISGGQAGQMIKEGLVKINQVTVTEKRKKVFLTDQVIFDNDYLIELKA